MNKAMQHGMGTIERAFELARSGACSSVADIKKRLSQEGYAQSQIQGPALAKQLRELINEARAKTQKA